MNQRDRFIMITIFQCLLLILLLIKYKSQFYAINFFPIAAIGVCLWGILEKKIVCQNIRAIGQKGWGQDKM